MSNIAQVLSNAQRAKLQVNLVSYGKEVTGVIAAMDAGLVSLQEEDGVTTYLDPTAIQIAQTRQPKKDAAWGGVIK